eukprot:6206575-Pyramimonas_sp.AAC.1
MLSGSACSSPPGPTSIPGLGSGCSQILVKRRAQLAPWLRLWFKYFWKPPPETYSSQDLLGFIAQGAH